MWGRTNRSFPLSQQTAQLRLCVLTFEGWMPSTCFLFIIKIILLKMTIRMMMIVMTVMIMMMKYLDSDQRRLTCVLCFLSLPAAQRLIMLMRIMMMRTRSIRIHEKMSLAQWGRLSFSNHPLPCSLLPGLSIDGRNESPPKISPYPLLQTGRSPKISLIQSHYPYPQLS